MKMVYFTIFLVLALSFGVIAAGCDEDATAVPADGMANAPLETDPCCQGDGPGCSYCNPSGFNNGGAWDPEGTCIQEIALDTVGTEVSCWDDAGSHSGKPYYQMRLGISDRDQAVNISCFIDELEADPALADLADLYTREAWCSETIAYWHMEAGIPYESGYRNGNWMFDWQLTNTTALMEWYEAEELLAQMAEAFPQLDIEGRGRWIDWSDLDYYDFQPGINAPLPGAYVCLKCYDDQGFGGVFLLDSGHSMMVDEMTVYRTLGGDVDHVELTFLEGNTAVGVNWEREMEDVREYTPWGSSYFGDCDNADGKKIIGFGIDLDENGDPIYDERRLHYETVINAEPQANPEGLPDAVEDNEPDFAAAIAGYAKLLGRDGIKITSSSDRLTLAGIPDGERYQWHFSKETMAQESMPVEIVIDLSRQYPVPVKAVMLDWRDSFIPDGYTVMWAGEDKEYNKALLPSLRNLDPEYEYTGPVPALFGKKGRMVHYVKFIFPPDTFMDDTTLEDMRLVPDWGPDTDVDVIPADETSFTIPDEAPGGGTSPCPEECACIKEAEAERIGVTMCRGERTVCGKNESGAFKYCYRKPQKAPSGE